MDPIQTRLTRFSPLNDYISPSALGSPVCVQDIVLALNILPICHHRSRNALFLEYNAGQDRYVLGKCLFRYDTPQQVTVTEFATANMRGEHHIDQSPSPNWMHVLRYPVHWIGMHLFAELISFCKASGVNCIRLVPDLCTKSMEFYQKIMNKFAHLFDKVSGPDSRWTIFFFLK